MHFLLINDSFEPHNLHHKTSINKYVHHSTFFLIRDYFPVYKYIPLISRLLSEIAVMTFSFSSTIFEFSRMKYPSELGLPILHSCSGLSRSRSSSMTLPSCVVPKTFSVLLFWIWIHLHPGLGKIFHLFCGIQMPSLFFNILWTLPPSNFHNCCGSIKEYFW